MPIPKGREKIYGKIAGHLQNLGYSFSVAKKKADKALADHPNLKDSNIKKKSKGKKKAKK